MLELGMVCLLVGAAVTCVADDRTHWTAAGVAVMALGWMALATAMR